MDANPGRLTNSPARTDVALLIRRAVRPTKGAHPLRPPPLAGSNPAENCFVNDEGRVTDDDLVRLERETGFEPATDGLGIRRWGLLK